MARTLSIAGVALLAVATPAMNVAALDTKAIAGLWQFPDRLVWIRIESDGSAYQCRIASRKPLARIISKGIFKAPDQIVWEEHWGAEKIEHRPGALTIHSRGNAFTFEIAKDPMAPECK